MITELLLAGAALLALKHKSTSGIGAAKRRTRRIWNEVAEAQRAGIDLTDPNAWQKHTSLLRRMSNGKLSRSSSDKPDEQRYFNQLRRAYKSIAGTGLQPDQSVVRNEYGDVVLIFNDYHLDELPTVAANWLMDNSRLDDYDYGYIRTIANIALGTLKLVWTTKKTHRGLQELLFGRSVPKERKMRISYLASPEKGGLYPEAWAHRLWESKGMNGNDKDILDGVLAATREIYSVGQAQEYCVQTYLDAHAPSEPAMFEDVPF